MHPIWIIWGYLLGSCPTGLILVKMLSGQDIRTVGSKNIGATNVGRVLGKKWAIFTAAVDISKGGIAVLIAMLGGLGAEGLALVGCASVLGHNYPIWLGFKGGKGVATTFGVVACFNFFSPYPALYAGIVWFVTMKLTRYVSLASMLSLLSIPLFMFFHSFPVPYIIASFFLALLSIWRHRANVQRLIAGNESKVAS